MLKIALSFALLALMVPALYAQTKHMDTSAPTKVTGDPTKTADGLEYWDIKAGTGATAKAGQTVVVHYTGWLTTGKKFDSSVDRGQPFDFPLGAGMVIKGWDEGVAGMKVGGKRQLRIPSDLAYGDAGHPPVIPQKATLIFDVELLGIK
jgi:FKBP-type peptidyl-prolyl cis-trans isomerase